MRASLDSVVGHVLDGRYEVTSRIARGGMATVFLATDRRLDREVAVKVMHPHLADDEQFIARFHREAKSAARMSHPNVVAVFDQGTSDDVVYLVMEYVAGTTLRDLLSERGALTPGEALGVLEPLLDALAAAHRAGVVHRDVKPENVLLTDDGRVKVADFGLARAASASQSGTTTGMLMGTAAYLSPELVMRGVADARSDVYAVGIMLFEMLTGRQPFVGEVPIQVVYQHVNDEVPPPSSLDPGLPVELDDLVTWATARDPDERPRDARELVVDVHRLRTELDDDILDREPQAPTALAVADGATPTDAQHATRVVRPLDVDAARAAAATRSGRPSRTGDVLDGADGRAALDRDDWGYGPGGRRRRRGLWAMVSVLLVAALVAGVAWFFTSGPGAYTVTPAVSGTASEATATLEAAGLGAQVREQFDEAVPTGTVIGTDPAAGDEVRKGATVDVFVSKGSEFTVVGPLAGLTVEQATTALDGLDLELAQAEPQFSETVPEGQVISQAPAEGEQVRRGESVEVVTSKGRQPIEVPVVTGAGRADAEAAITEAGLAPQVAEEFSETVPDGLVISQSPSEGTLFADETVELVVSKGPPLVTVPNVVGQQVDEARTALEGAGFVVEEERILGGYFGTVRAQDPGADSQAPKGSTVTITIV